MRTDFVSASEAEVIAREAIVFAYPMLFNYNLGARRAAAADAPLEGLDERE